MSLNSILHLLWDDIHGVVAVTAIVVYIILEIWANVNKHERLSYRAYLWAILLFLLAANLGIHKLLAGQSSHPQTEDALEQIGSSGRIRIGISHVAWGPFLCLDEEKVEITGFDIEVAKHVAETIKDEIRRRGTQKEIRLNFVLFNWTDMLEAVKDNNVDFAISAITKNSDRERRYNITFSDSYYQTHYSYAMFRNYDNDTGLSGRKAFVIKETTSYDVAKGLVGDIPTERQNWFVAYNDFRQFRPEYPIIVDDDALLKYRLYRMKLMGEVKIHTIKERVEEYGIAVNYKQPDLLRLINDSINELKENKVNGLSRLEDNWLKGGAAKERCLKEVG